MIDLHRLLSPNFTLSELAGADDPQWRQAQITGLFQLPASGPRQLVHERLQVLAQTILQPIRDHIRRPLRINSGYRSPEKNAATKGSSKTSQHILGEAADISVPGWSDADLRVLFDWIAYHSRIPFGQVIYEDARPNSEGGSWIHVSLGAPYRAASRSGERLVWSPVTGYQRV